MKNIIFILLLFSCAILSGQARSFPTAEGFGADATGGRNGQVLHVTNLEWNDNQGSLKWALEQNFARIIVFDVSGTIRVTNEFYEVVGQSRSNLTIAGQTAPRGGITIEHNWFGIVNVDNFIMRHIRFVQVGFFNPGGPINATGFNLNTTGNSIVDHCSFRYSWNSVAIGARHNENVTTELHTGATIQNCIMSECRTGILVGPNASVESEVLPDENYSFHHNLVTHISHRFPNATGNGDFEIINNVAYNFSSRLSAFFNNSNTNLIGNTYKEGTIFNLGLPNLIATYIFANGNNTPIVYSSDNAITSITNNVQETDVTWDGFMNEWQDLGGGALDQNSVASEAIHRSNTIFNFNNPYPVTIQSRTDAYNSVLSDVGANKYLNEDGSFGVYLDDNDAEYISDVTNGTYTNSSDGTYINRTDLTELNYPVLPNNVRSVGYDTDQDGMPNVWEIANGLDPNVADNNGNDLDPNYTNIEMFINLVDGTPPPPINSPIVTVTPSTQTITQGQSFTTPVATANDVEDGDVTASIVESGDVLDNNTIGTHVRVYTATDSESNTGSNTATLIVNASNVDVTGISWNNDNQTVNVGNTLDLSFTILPGNATNQGTAISSDNTSVVSNAGSIIGAGTANLTITTNDGGFTDVMAVTVNSNTIPLTAVSFNNASLSIAVNGSVSAPITKTPTNATESVTYSSSDTAILTVNPTTGVITGISEGTATLTVTADVTNGVSDTIQVTVLPASVSTGTRLFRRFLIPFLD